MNQEITSASDKCHGFTGELSGSFEYCEDNITPQWQMFATALWNSWVNVNRHQHNQSPSITLCGPYSSYGAEDLTLCLFHRIDAICQCYQEQAACFIFCPSLSLGTMKHMSLFSTVNERLTLLPRRQGMFAFRTQAHTQTHTHSAMQTLHAVPLSAAFFFFCVFSRCRVLFVTPFLCSALLGSPARRLVTAPNRIRSTARLDIHDLSIHQWGEGEREKEREMAVYLRRDEIETQEEGEKLAWVVTCKHEPLKPKGKEALDRHKEKNIKNLS